MVVNVAVMIADMRTRAIADLEVRERLPYASFSGLRHIMLVLMSSV